MVGTLCQTATVYARLSLERSCLSTPQTGRSYLCQLCDVKTLACYSRFESWKTDRPMRREGFNIGARRSSPSGDHVAVENSGHGGAGVAASWACAALATESLLEAIGGQKW